MKSVYESPVIRITRFSQETAVTTSFGLDGFDIYADELEGW